ncbi:MAG: efflux RND transporter permease subunit [Desulfomonilia bacterium]|jgi:HAE1 family hydrophobic/amphiphilic exporter-1
MNLPELSVRRRVTITMLILIITLFGVVSFSDLGLDLLPELEFPYVSVVTTYEGVGSEEIETLITKPIEEAVSTVEGIKEVHSVTTEGVSSVYCEFQWGTSLDFAAQDVREKISWIADFLPEDADSPMVLKFNVSDMPVLEYAVTGMENTQVLRDFIDDVMKPRIERLEGIASVFIFGGKEREIQILVDPQRLKSTGVSLETVIAGVRAGNLNLSGGHVEAWKKEYLIRTRGYFDDLDQIRSTIISVDPQGRPVRLADVAEVQDSFKELRGYERANRRSSVIIAVMKQSGVNTLQAVNRVKKELKEMEPIIPEDVSLHLILDQGNIIQRSISATASNGIEGGLIAMVVIFIFLRSIRPTLAIALAIPLSVIATFIGMKALGYTFNIMTLGGIALGVGMLVDNAVVVIENTFRHLEEGTPRDRAAVNGATEVGMAITASTLTTVAVFLPMSLSQSIAGKLARPLSLTVCVSLLASLFIAITIVPAIAATVFKKEKSVYERIEAGGWTGRMRAAYAGMLEKVLHRRAAVVGVSMLLFVAALALSPLLGTEFMPKQDLPLAMLDITLPEGMVLDETDHIVRQVEDIFLERPEVITCVSMVGITSGAKYAAAQGQTVSGVNRAQVFARFKEKEDREKSAEQIIEEIRRKLPVLHSVDYLFEDLTGTLLGTGSSPVEINLYGSDLAVLDELSTRAIQELSGVEGLKDLDKSLKKSKPELHVRVDRDKAAKMGLTVAQVASTVETAMLGKVVSRFHDRGDEYDMRVRFQEPFRSTMETLSTVMVSSPLGFSVPLSQLALLEESVGPVTINRKNQNRVVSITGSTMGRDLGSITRDIERIMRTIDMPQGYFYEMSGTYEDMQTSFRELTKALIIAIILIYMIMAAQFESLSQPFIVMFTLPLAYIGVVFGLMATGKTLSVPAFMGLIILMGIVVNNGIVMIDYINALRRGGMERYQAIIKGATVRLRPILITSVTTIVGMLPMAFSSSEGAEMRSPMAVAVAFGLLFSMVLTLFVIPCVYSIVDSLSQKIRTRASRLVLGEE